MVDLVDQQNERDEVELDASVGLVRRAAANIPKGEAGECEECGEYFERIVNGHCGRCRDKLGLP